MKKISYFIPSISCGHCAHTIKMELSELTGVKTVDVDIPTKTVAITFGAPATEEDIEKLLTEINYPPQK